MSTPMDRAFTVFRTRGTDEDLVALLDACHPRAFGLCLRILRNREDAEDASQRVLLEIAHHAGEMTNAVAFRTWLFRVCRARSADLQRRRARRESHEAVAARSETSNGHAGPGYDEEARRLLFAALADLPDEDRTLVLDHYFNKVPLRELGERHACSKVAIWKRLQRIRSALLRRLSGAGLAAFVPVWNVQLRGEPPPAGATLATELGPTLPFQAISRSAPRVRPFLWVASGAACFLVFSLGMTIGREGTPSRIVHTDLVASSPPAGVRQPAAPTPLPAEAVASFPVPAPASIRPDVEGPGSEELREMIRRLFRQIQIQRKTGAWMPVEVSQGIAPLTELIRVDRHEPSKNPERFADVVGLLYEVAGEECGIPLSEADRKKVSLLQSDLVEALRRVPAGPPPVRLLAAVEADLAFARGMAELLPKNEAALMMASDIDRILKRGKRKSLPENLLQEEIVSDWAAAAGAEKHHAPILELAASRYVKELTGLTAEFRRAGESFDEDDYSKNLLDRRPVRPYEPVRRMEYQIQALKAQADALTFLRNGLDPALAGRLSASEPWNYAISRMGTLIEMRGE